MSCDFTRPSDPEPCPPHFTSLAIQATLDELRSCYGNTAIGISIVRLFFMARKVSQKMCHAHSSNIADTTLYHTLTTLRHTLPYSTTLYHTPPYSTILHHTLPYSTILHHTPPYSTILYHTLPYSTILHHTPPYSTIPHHTLPYSTILHHTPPYSTILCHTLPYSTILYHTPPHSTTLYHTLPYSTILYHFLFLIRKPHPSHREERSGHAATIKLLPWQKLAVTDEICALYRSHPLS